MTTPRKTSEVWRLLNRPAQLSCQPPKMGGMPDIIFSWAWQVNLHVQFYSAGVIGQGEFANFPK